MMELYTQEKVGLMVRIHTGGMTWMQAAPQIPISLPLRVWSHVAFSWGQRGLHLYLNGRLIAKNEAPIRQNLGTREWLLGDSAVHQPRPGPPCVMDEVRIYDRVLTEAEIKALYDLEKSGIQPATPRLPVFPKPRQ